MPTPAPPPREVEEYRKFITLSLHDLSWWNDYPIDANIGIYCFLEAFRKNGFSFEERNDRVSISGVRDLAGQFTHLEAEVLLEDIPRGLPGNVVSSPRAFDNSIYRVFNQFARREVSEEDIFYKRVTPEEIALIALKISSSREIRKTMEKEFLGYFEKYQEHLLVPVRGFRREPHPDTRKPELFDKVVRQFPWELHSSATIFQLEKESFLTPTVETLIREYGNFDPGEFTEQSTDILLSGDQIRSRHERRKGLREKRYHPSVAVMDELFLGMYLRELSTAKGYDLREDRGSEVENFAYLAGSSFHALKEGRKLFQVTKRATQVRNLD